MIPLPWVTYGLVSRFSSPGWGGVAMLFMIIGCCAYYRQRPILFQWAFSIFAFFKIWMVGRGIDSPLLLNTAWLSGVGLGTFVGITLLLKRPFTVELVEEFFPAEMVTGFHFIRINECISLVWGIHFWISAIISQIPIPSGIQVVLTIVSMGLASCFTKNFPRWYRYHRYLPRHRSGKEEYQPFVEI
jgi:hypothetical protein